MPVRETVTCFVCGTELDAADNIVAPCPKCLKDAEAATIKEMQRFIDMMRGVEA